MGGGVNLKKKSAAFHPNSRKAGQKIKRLAHDQRVSIQKKLRELKESVVKEKIGWFHSETDNIDRPLCPHNLDALVERFLSRRENDINYWESKHDLPDRRSNNTRATLKADELRRLHDGERQSYSGCGIEIPDVSTTKGLAAIKGWGSDIIDLIKIPMRKVNKKQLAGAGAGVACKSQNCSLVDSIDVSL